MATTGDPPLTIKQQRVCELVVRGLTAKQIGKKLGIGARTVETHRENVYRKLSVRNAIELVHKILEGKNAAVLGGRTDGFEDGTHRSAGD